MTRKSPVQLDAEIATALSRSKPKPKTRTRPFGRAARRTIAKEISVYVDLPSAARAALETAREAADQADYEGAIRKLRAALPATLWIGYDADRDLAMVSSVKPMWVDEDPQGEDPADWQKIDRGEIARMLVEDA